jgi:hypothetical protein
MAGCGLACFLLALSAIAEPVPDLSGITLSEEPTRRGSSRVSRRIAKTSSGADGVLTVLFYSEETAGEHLHGMKDLEYKCKRAKKCVFTADRSRINRSNTHIWFNGQHISTDSTWLPLWNSANGGPVPAYRRPGQLWLIEYEESPCHNWLFQSPFSLGLFNISVTPHSKSSVYNHLPPGLVDEQYLLDQSFFKSWEQKVEVAAQEKLAHVMWVASNCGSSVGSGRLEYIKELSKHIAVDSYGHCLQNKKLDKSIADWVKMDDPGFMELNSKYLFVIAWENCGCNSYITEKFWRTLHVGSIPVYFGALNMQEWSPQLATQGYVNVRKYPSPKDLAEFLKALAANQTRYESYLAWKKKGKLDNPSLVAKIRNVETGEKRACLVCNKLAELSGHGGLGHSRRTVQVSPESFGSCSPEASPISSSAKTLEMKKSQLAMQRGRAQALVEQIEQDRRARKGTW